MKVEASTIRRTVTIDIDPEEAAELCTIIARIDSDVKEESASLRRLFSAFAAVRDGRELGGH